MINSKFHLPVAIVYLESWSNPTACRYFVEKVFEKTIMQIGAFALSLIELRMF